MRPRIRRSIAALGAAGLLAAAAGCGGAAATTATSGGGSSSSNTAATQAPAAPDLSGLASRLGVSTAKLEQAMQAIRRPQAGSAPGDMAAALAKRLGVATSKVQAALESVRPSGTPPPQPGATQS